MKFTQEQSQGMYEFIKRASGLYWDAQDTMLEKELQSFEQGGNDEFDSAKEWEHVCAVITDDAGELVKKIDEDES